MGEEGPGAPQGCRGQLASPLGAVDAGKPCGPAWMFVCCPSSTCKAGGDKSLYPSLHLKIDTLQLMVPFEAQQSPRGAQISKSQGLCYRPCLVWCVPSSGKAGRAKASPLGDTQHSRFLESFDVMAA